MTTTPDQSTRFDYIVVGSGAGGAPLAARLAQQGLRVLVIEAGSDHVETGGDALDATLVPALHGVSTEHEGLSWQFFVKHYDNPPAGDDPKLNQNPPGIFYPRAATLGGCTVHNAMITIAGPDSDWEDLADFVADDSWRGGAMRAYFQKLERNDYHPPPKPPPTTWLGRTRDLAKWLFGFSPDYTGGRHGFNGWLHTSVTNVSLGLRDRQLVGMLKGALRQARHTGLDRGWTLVRRFFRGEIFRTLDPNHAQTQAESPEGVVLVPLAVCGERTTIHQNKQAPYVMRGRRSSPREFLLETQSRHPDKLTIWTDTHVTKVLFDDGARRPRAVGVEVRVGRNLYRAHKEPAKDPGELKRVFVEPDGEVILSGGAFNTPQMLMLSGIGDHAALEGAAEQGGDPHACALHGRDGEPLLEAGRPRRVHLPGVGRNLQDRYEVTVVSDIRSDFTLLDGAKFALPAAGQPPDRHLKEWRAEGTGIYTSNGTVLGVLKRSKPELEQPDLFIFGIPLPFYGYEVGYSRIGDIHDKFTWAILKSHTRNTEGTVTLRSVDPLDVPEINFRYFNEGACEDTAFDPDLLALVDGVKFVRGIASRAGLVGSPILRERHPGLADVPEGNDERLKDWIRRVAWGHHACGTCRMGPDRDQGAVLDSRFRVRDVDGLRVVDASIFPRIPGYFIVTNIYMASEKAADTLVEDRRHARRDDPRYPQALRLKEAEEIAVRRAAARTGMRDLPAPPTDAECWPQDIAGIALSGGGVRSATFNLGVLQALARGRLLRRFDFMSTVSGGGYIGAFLGRWFDRLRPASACGGTDREPPIPAADRIERELVDPESPAIDWLRKHGNYIAPGGAGDARYNIAVFVRNLLSVYLVVGSLLFGLFGLANAIRYGLLDPANAAFRFIGFDTGDLPLGRLLQALLGVFFSPWFVVFELIALFVVVPRIVGYWLVSQDRHERYDGVPLFATLVLSGVLLYWAVRDTFSLPILFLGLAPLAAVIHVELAWRHGRVREEATGSGGVETQRLRARNYLTYDLGLAISLAGGALVFALIDTIGHGLQQVADNNDVYLKAFASLMSVVAALAPVGRFLAGLFAGEKSGEPHSLASVFRKQIVAGALALVMLVAPLVFVSFAAHMAFDGGAALTEGVLATAVALVLTLIFAHPSAVTFVNRSSLAQTYAARLSRAYLGATNPLRLRPQAANVTEAVPGDDVPSIRDYRPHATGGPLHLINVTVNQTVDFTSQRGNRTRKGENVMVDALGITVGQRWHSAWADRVSTTWKRSSVKKRARLVPLGHLPGTDHPLVDETGAPTNAAEMLSLRQWIGISGASFGPGSGQTTQLGTALLFGLTNLRTGYWWNSGITEAARDGFPPLTFMRRASFVLYNLFQTQGLLLSEWIARFPGPWDQYWHMSDGGHFEVLGAYELIRRRVPRIIVSDASADPTYDCNAFANLVRKVRIDFDASIEPFDFGKHANSIPKEVRELLGTLEQLKASAPTDCEPSPCPTKRAALFRVTYSRAPECVSILLYVKATTAGDENVDVTRYRRAHPEFPQEPTEDQFFDEEQWESYRCLGDHAMSKLFQDTEWFWEIPLRKGGT